MGLRAMAPLLLLAAIWGSSYVFIEIALRDLAPGVVACGRQLIAAACLVTVALRGDALRLEGHQLRWVVTIAVIMVAGPTLLVAAGQQRVPSSLAGILVAVTPVASAVIALAVDSAERSGPMELAGIGIGLLGVVLLFGLDLGGSGDALAGGAAILMAAVGYAAGGFLVKSRASSVPPLGLAVIGSAVSALLLLPVALVSLPDERPSAGSLAALAELGIVGTAAGWLLYYGLITRLGPQRASLVQYLAPGFAVALGVMVLGEPLTAGVMTGLALVVGGSWLAVRRRPPVEQVPRP